MNRKALGMGLFGLALLSGPKVWSSDGERLPLQKILQQEAEGEAIDRAALMAGSANATDQERWLAGQVKRDGSWEDPVKIEKLHGRLANYRKERGSNELNLEGHLRMARWCAEHGLSEQEKSHWYGVLQFQPDHVDWPRSASIIASSMPASREKPPPAAGAALPKRSADNGRRS